MVESLIKLIVWIAVLGGVFWLISYLLDYIGLPEPFNKVARVVLVVAAVLILIMVLVKFAGTMGVAIP